jgi:mRNA export factor
MDCAAPMLVVATADRHCVVYDLRKPTAQLSTTQTPFTYQSVCIAAFPDKTGYAVGSVEGRVSIQHINKADEGRNFRTYCIVFAFASRTVRIV